MKTSIDLTARAHRGRRAAAWVAVWSAYALLNALMVSSQSSVPFRHALTEALARLVPLSLASIAIWFVCARPWRNRTAFIAVQVAMAAVIIAIAKGSELALLRSTTNAAVWHAVVDGTWMYQLFSSTLEYSTLLGVILVLQARRRQREVEALSREAELAAARAQLHPHFLLNSLNSIISLIDSDPRGAREMVVRLSELLQASFRGLDDETVTLQRELEMVRAYLDIEQIRFGARLRVSIDVDEIAGSLQVPPMLLQPIVENAVRHGIAPHTREGEVRISGRESGGRLQIEVRDSGDGAAAAALANGGRGLSLTRLRLESVYPSDYSLSFVRPADGFAVRLDLPAQ
jgi:sensor histidine kinase YesM